MVNFVPQQYKSDFMSFKVNIILHRQLKLHLHFDRAIATASYPQIHSPLPLPPTDLITTATRYELTPLIYTAYIHYCMYRSTACCYLSTDQLTTAAQESIY